MDAKKAPRVENIQEIINRLHEEIEQNGGKHKYKISVELVESVVVEKQGDWYKKENGEYEFAPSTAEISKIQRTIYQQEFLKLDLSKLVTTVNQ